MVDKAEMVISFIRLGMDFEKAAIAAGLQLEDIDELREDAEFQYEIKIAYACMEKELLERHESAAKIQESKGGTHAAEWMLEKINPNRYGKSVNTKLSGLEGVVFPTEIVLKGRSSDADS